MIRFPDGIEGGSFYQKDTPRYAPDWVRTIAIAAPSAKRVVRYAICDSKRTLMWFGNQGVIEFHPWLSRADRLERPTHIVFDLDPPEGGYERAVDAAVVVRGILDDLGLASAVKTSGSKGVHVYVPLERRYPYEEARRAADEIAARAAAAAPERVTTEWKRAERHGRVLVDVARNWAGAHVAAPYSPRARPGAPVSFPVTWERLAEVQPSDFTIRNVPEMLAGGDPWNELMPDPQRLPRELLG